MKKYEVRYWYGNVLYGVLDEKEFDKLIADEAYKNCPALPIFRTWEEKDGWTCYDTSINVWKVKEI